MRRWRTVGLVGSPTVDGRVIEGTVTLRDLEVPLGRVPRRERHGHVGATYDRRAAVRVDGEKIQARLGWRDRHATPAFDCIDTEVRGEWGEPDALLVLRYPRLVGLCVGGPSAWEELR